MMKRTVLVFLIALLVLALVSVACDDSDDDTSSSSATSTSPIDTTTTPPATEPTTSSTTTSDVPDEPILAVGQQAYYGFFEWDEEVGYQEFGHNGYEVVSEEASLEGKIFTIASSLKLQSSAVCQPTTAAVTLKVDEGGNLISYVSSASIGSG